MAANSSNNWRHDMNEDNDSSSKAGMEVDRVRQLTASRIPGGSGGVNALTSGGGGPGALERALMQHQQTAQFPAHNGGAYGSRISNEELLAAAAAASVGANAHLSMAFAPDTNPKSMIYPPNSSRISPLESAQLHPINPKTNILQLSMGPTMTSPYAAHLQMAQRAFQVQQNQEQLIQQQRQFILQQMGSGSMEETASMPGLSQISNMDILQFLEQKQQQDMQAKMLAAAAASSVSAAAPKPPPVPSAPAAATASSNAALTTRKESSFPLKLHSILANPEFQEYITWLPNGRSWRILKPAAFERVVIPLVFRHAKYASFMRQVNGWGFKRITGGPASGAAHNSYYHQYFIREYPQLCLQMKRVGKTPNGGKSSEGAARGGDHDDASVTSADGDE